MTDMEEAALDIFAFSAYFSHVISDSLKVIFLEHLNQSGKGKRYDFSIDQERNSFEF